MAQEPEEDFEGEEGGEPEFEGGGGKRKRMILFIAIPLALVLGGGAIAYFTGLANPLIALISGKKAADAAADTGDMKKDKGAAKADAKAGTPAEANAGGAEGQAAVFYDVPEMLVNIDTEGHKRSYLKLKISLELGSEDDVNRIDNVLPRIIDNFQVYLRELRLEDLQGSAGMFRLREELLARVSAAARPAQVKDVLFKEMIVQ
jgi:flagellar FliL protein